MFKVLVSDKLGQAGLDIFNAAEDVTADVLLNKSKEELMVIPPEYHGWIVRSETRRDADMIAVAKNLKVIGRAGAGVDNIDVNAASQHGVIVMNTPGANSMATAEQTMALMLAVSRFTGHAHASMKVGEWERNKFNGQELYGKTLGIIGFGQIGKLVAERSLAFGMTVLAYDPYVSEYEAQQRGVTLVELADLYAQSDYITLHTALTATTKQMINADAIAQMKQGVVILNVARGSLVDEVALLEGLNSGKIKGAGLDVFAKEPPAADNPLVGHPKVTHAPHLGASTVESQRKVAVMVAEQTLDVLRGKDVRNAVNMPFTGGPNFATMRPHLDLASKLGVILATLATGDINRIEIEVHGETVEEMVRPIASSLLAGMLANRSAEELNFINAPIIAEKLGVTMAQTIGLSQVGYPNMIACKAYWEGGDETIVGFVMAEKYPRIVQLNGYELEAKPEGVVLYLKNQDQPGVIGQVGSLLAEHNINIAEWRLGRTAPGGEALSLINLDSAPDETVLNALRALSAVTEVRVIVL